MKVRPITSYQLGRETFPTLKAVREHVENEIGKILDATPLRMDPKQALVVFSAIVANRTRLAELLTIEIEDDEWQGPARNVLEV